MNLSTLIVELQSILERSGDMDIHLSNQVYIHHPLIGIFEVLSNTSEPNILVMCTDAYKGIVAKYIQDNKIGYEDVKQKTKTAFLYAVKNESIGDNADG